MSSDTPNVGRVGGSAVRDSVGGIGKPACSWFDLRGYVRREHFSRAGIAGVFAALIVLAACGSSAGKPAAIQPAPVSTTTAKHATTTTRRVVGTNTQRTTTTVALPPATVRVVTVPATRAPIATSPPPPPPAQVACANVTDAAGSPLPCTGGCTPGYSPCIPPGDDVDCAGGSGNGPRYVQGPITVTGPDIYGLDRDGNGVGCQ